MYYIYMYVYINIYIHIFIFIYPIYINSDIFSKENANTNRKKLKNPIIREN